MLNFIFTKNLKSEYFAFFVLVTIPLLFGIGQEIVAIYSPHDDYYFILRAVSLDLNGSYLAPIKEILYPLYIRISWLYGLGLRNFEVLCYGLALFCLWVQISALAQSRLVAWLSTIPLAFFCYQHAIFDRATPDALQLILLPLSFSTSIYLYLKKVNWTSSILAGVVVGAHVLTRPEGVLFILPPLVSLIFVWYQASQQANYVSNTRMALPKLGAILVIVFLSQQFASAINWHYFGFWAPTIMKSASFQRNLSALMAIEPDESQKQRYAPVSKSTLERAYQVSPSFLKAKPFFDQHLDGHGWSAAAIQGYRAVDGSISGGHFQWALLDAGAYVAGPKANAMLEYFDTVANELRGGFDRGEIKERRVISTALGPDFSVFDSNFWSSMWKIGRFFLNLSAPSLPTIASIGTVLNVESDFNKVALRRTALLESSQWQLSGWAVNLAKGMPKTIDLDQEATDGGIRLSVKERPDVAKAIFGLEPGGAPAKCKCGIEITSPGSWAGNLRVVVDNHIVAIPLTNLKNLTSGRAYDGPDIHLHVDNMVLNNETPAHSVIPITSWVTKAVFYAARVAVFVAFFLLAAILLIPRVSVFKTLDLTSVFLVSSLAASIVLPRLVLLSAIDANMYPGDEIRYIASGTFSVHFASFFCVGVFISVILKAKQLIKHK